MNSIEPLAPIETEVGDYDRRHLALYAALLEADDAGRSWDHAASLVMRLDVADNNAEACWRSHLERARWIVGEGLGSALMAFNTRGIPVIAD